MARVGWDSAIAREQVVEKLRVGLLTAGVQFEEIELPAGGSPDRVAHGLLERLERMPSGAVSITGVEWAYPEGGDLNDTLGALSFLRGPLNAVPLRQVWWMPEHITEKFVVAVPDFESWFRLRLHLSEVPAFDSGQFGMDSSQGVMSTAEASHLADQLVERIRTAESRGIAPDRVWRELGRPLIQVLVQGGLRAQDWLARIAGYRQQVEEQVEALASARGGDDPEMLLLMEELAYLAWEQSDLAGARKLWERVLESRRRLLGEADPDTLRTKSNLAWNLFEQGDLIEAEQEMRNVVQESERALGADNTQSLMSRNRLANILTAKGVFGEARKVYEEALETSRRVYGTESSEALGVTMNLANVLGLQGDLPGALRLLADVCAIQSRTLGPTHPITVLTEANLAVLLHSAGRLEEARRIGQKASEATRSLLGPRHPLTVQRTTNLLDTLVSMGEMDDARRLLLDLKWILTKDPSSLSRVELDARQIIGHLLPKLEAA